MVLLRLLLLYTFTFILYDSLMPHDVTLGLYFGYYSPPINTKR